MVKSQVLDKGNYNCRHSHVYYIDNAFDGQAFWCDEPDCKRHEKIPYSPGEKIIFPANAYIRTPNPHLGGPEVYSHRADKDGIVRRVLSADEVIFKKSLEAN